MRYHPGSIFPRKNSKEYERNAALYVRIGPSQIPGAGQGVFAAADIAAGVELGPYRGVVLSKAEMDASDSVYIVEIDRPGSEGTPDAIMYVDARDATDPERSNWTRYINDPHNTTLTANIQLDQDGYFRSLCAIPTGCEVLWSYGSKYWPDEDIAEVHQIKVPAGCTCAPVKVALKAPLKAPLQAGVKRR